MRAFVDVGLCSSKSYPGKIELIKCCWSLRSCGPDSVKESKWKNSNNIAVRTQQLRMQTG